MLSRNKIIIITFFICIVLVLITSTIVYLNTQRQKALTFEEFSQNVTQKEECIKGISLINSGYWRPYNGNDMQQYLYLNNRNFILSKSLINTDTDIEGSWEINSEIITLFMKNKFNEEQINMIKNNFHPESKYNGVVKYDIESNSISFNIAYEANGTKDIKCQSSLYSINIFGEYFYKS